MTRGPVTFLKKPAIAHMLRAAAGLTNQNVFVLVGTGAVIAQIKNLPLDLTHTRELDIQMPDDEQGNLAADLIDGSIGEGSQFDATFGYYAHAIPEGTAQMPNDWRDRVKTIAVPGYDGLTCVCPDVSDIALSKLAAWREKDVTWLKHAKPTLLDVSAMRKGLAALPKQSMPMEELKRRLAIVESFTKHSTSTAIKRAQKGHEID